MNRRALKVGVAGTHSTGKTTLLSSLKGRLVDEGLRVTVVKNLARAARDAGFAILTQQTEDTALWIMSEGIRRESSATLISDVILVDRAIFDALGYLEAALQVTGRSRDERRHPILEGISRSYARDYDLLVITKLDEAIPLGQGRLPMILAVVFLTSENRDTVERQIMTFILDRLKGRRTPDD